MNNLLSELTAERLAQIANTIEAAKRRHVGLPADFISARDRSRPVRTMQDLWLQYLMWCRDCCIGSIDEPTFAAEMNALLTNSHQTRTLAA